jgi:hypothetical protein
MRQVVLAKSSYRECPRLPVFGALHDVFFVQLLGAFRLACLRLAQ